MIYADNSGIYRDFKFKVKPAITLSINKQVNEYVGIRGSLGAQIFDSGDYALLNPKKLIKWENEDQAYGFKGTGYFADLVPIFTTNPNAEGMLMSSIQFYAGLGFGVMFVKREQKTLKNVVLEGGVLAEGDVITSNETSFLPYVPIKTGISTNLSGDWDFALDFVLLITTNSELDGNNLDSNTVKPDMSGQIQFTVKRYFGPSW